MPVVPFQIRRGGNASATAITRYRTFFCYGVTRSGKTRFSGTFPNVLVIADASERGFTTLETMPEDDYYHPGNPPVVFPVRNQQEMTLALAIAERWVRAGLIDTVVIDSATYYANTYLTVEKMRSRAATGQVDTRALYGALAEHMANVRIQIHSWPCHVVWTALISPPDDNKPGGPALAGSSKDTFPAGCDHIFIHRVWEHPGYEATDTEPAQPPYTVFEARTKPYGKYIAGSRDGGRLPDPIFFPTFRSIVPDLGLIDIDGNPIEFELKEVPAAEMDRAIAEFAALEAQAQSVAAAAVVQPQAPSAPVAPAKSMIKSPKAPPVRRSPPVSSRA